MLESDIAAGSAVNTNHHRWTWAVPLLLVVGIAAAWFLWPGFREFAGQAYEVLASENRQRIEAWVRQYGPWGFIVIYALMIMQTVVPVLPSVVAMVVAVLAFGPWVGGLVAWTGMLLAASLGYLIGRAFGPVTVDRLLGGKARQNLSDTVDRYGLWAVIAARVSPVLSTDAISIVAGLVGLKFWKFLIATAVGTLPLTMLIAFLGEDVERLKSGLIWISVFSIGTFAAWVIYDRRRGKVH